MPSAPHVEDALVGQASWCGLVWSLAGPQVPSAVPDCLSAAMQAWQSVSHAVSQHRPSAQNPVAHTRHGGDLQSPFEAMLQETACGFCG